MKHLKKFNEELKPGTYMRAGKSLSDKGHTKRGQELIDYSKSKSPESPTFVFILPDGSQIDTKWNHENSVFETKEGKRIYLDSGRLWTHGSRVPTPPGLAMRPTRPVSLYVGSRKEAINLVNFLKNTGSIKNEDLPSVNDLYNDRSLRDLNKNKKYNI